MLNSWPISYMAVGASDHPLAALFAGGETGDVWRFDQQNTDAAGTSSDPFSTATGSINGLQLTQGTGTRQPKIRITNGVEMAYFDGSDMLTHTFEADVAQPGTIIIGLSSTDTTTHAIYTGSSSTKRWQLSNSSTDDLLAVADATLSISPLKTPLNNAVISSIYNGASSSVRVNRGQRISGNAGAVATNQISLGALWDATVAFTGDIAGFIFINRVLTTAELKLAENWMLAEMNLMRGELGDVDAPLPDFAVAFWKLFTSYTGNCLTVERMSDSTTQDIGFTSTGALDTAAIASFCGASDGRLHTWYNQCTGLAGIVGGDGTSATRPKIYDGASGLMVTNANGHLSFDKNSPTDNRPQLQSAVRGPANFTLMCSFQTSDTTFMALGEHADSGEYLGCAQSGSATTTLANDNGTTRAVTFYKDGVSTSITTRGGFTTAAADNTPHRWVMAVPGYTPGASATLGWYPSTSTTFRMSPGYYNSYVFTYGTSLTASELAVVDQYILNKLA